MQGSLLERAPPPAVALYTDGGCDPNPGPGGWAAILRFPDREVTLTGNAPHTTNNRMELEAAIAALAYLKGSYGPCRVDLYTDSEYLRQGMTEWIDGWFASGWKTRDGRPVKNQDLWHKLYGLIHAHHVSWHWVQGHAGDVYNERADRMAAEARGRLSASDTRMSSSLPAPTTPEEDGGHVHPQVEISVQVSCLGSQGPCGWAAVLCSDRAHKVLRGSLAGSTSNAALLQAAIGGLKALKTSCNVTVYTVNDYLGKGAGQWVLEWRRWGWKTKGGKPVKNRDLWEALLAAAKPHRVTWEVVRGASSTADLAEAKEIAAQEATQASTTGEALPDS
jgi:ribonuclease HI